jgi:predicted alpha/beta-fold hydrolase
VGACNSLGVAVLGGAATYLVGGAATGAAQSAVSIAPQSAGSNFDYYVTELFRPTGNTAPASAAGGGQAVASQQARMILTHGLAGDFSSSDRSYLSQLVAAETGASQTDADKLVDDVLAQAKREAN